MGFVFFLRFSQSFYGIERVMYASVFSPRHSGYPLNSSAGCLIIKW